MRIDSKKFLIAFASVIIVVLVVVMAIISSNKKANYDYYYNFTYDDNLVSQTVKVYSKDGKQLDNYILFYNDDVLSSTKGDAAILSLAKHDLKDHVNIQIAFRDNIDKKYDVSYKK